MRRLRVFVILLTMVVYEYEALRCFTCSYTNENDHLCIDDPISVQGQWQVNCTKKYCTIQRQELQNGQVNSFMRDCQEVPIVLDGMIEDENFKTYFRSCSTDLCNSGNGISSGGGSVLNPDNPGENLIIDGLDPNGGGGSRIKSIDSIVLFVCGVLVAIVSSGL